MKLFIILFSLISINVYSQSVQTGTAIKASSINEIQEKLTNSQNELTALKSLLKNKTIIQKFPLWNGNLYVDGASIYTLWGANQHQAWDYMELHVGYDSGALDQIVIVDLGPSYVYNGTTQAHSMLFTTYDGHYRRVIIRTTGLDIFNGEGAGWYIKRIIGVKKIAIP